jgi:hypothetical protein
MRQYNRKFDMNKTRYMSNRVFPIGIRAALQTFWPWEVSVSRDSDPEFSFKLGQIVREEVVDGIPVFTQNPVNCDVFKVREKAFGVQQVEDALELFKEFGPWRASIDNPSVGMNIRFSMVLALRDFFEEALLARSLEKLHRAKDKSRDELIEEFIGLYLSWPLKIDLQFGDPPQGVVLCHDIQESLRASVFLDKLDGLSWRKCHRKDCGRLFKLTTKKAKLYCSTDCAHLQSVRSYNSRKAARTKTGAGKGKV